jgi:hypothetical protein
MASDGYGSFLLLMSTLRAISISISSSIISGRAPGHGNNV